MNHPNDAARGHSTRRVTRGLGFVLGMSALVACKGSSEYAHLRIDLALAGLTDDQRKLVSAIVLSSHPDASTDPNATYRVEVKMADLDAGLTYHLDYIPNPQSGAFVVTAQLVDAKSNELAHKAAKVTLAPGKSVSAKLDFVSEITKGAACQPEGDAVTITDGPDGGFAFSFLWDDDRYLFVYTDAATGKGDLARVWISAKGEIESPPISINQSARVSTLPSIVKSGDGYALAWQEGDRTDAPVTVQLRHLDRDGAPEGNTRQVVTSGPEARPYLVAAYDDLALAWMDDSGSAAMPDPAAFVGLVRSDDFAFTGGEPVALVPPGSPGSSGGSFPAMAVVDDTLRVSFVNAGHDVFSATVGPDLALSVPIAIHSSTFVAQQLSVAAAGHDLFTAWEDLSGEIDLGRERIRGAYTSPEGDVVASGFVHEIDTGSANWPRSAWNGSDSVAVVYYQYRDFGSQIYMTRYSTSGERIDGVDMELTNVAGGAKYPDIQFRGRDFDGHDHFGVAWVDDHTRVRRVYFLPIVCD